MDAENEALKARRSNYGKYTVGMGVVSVNVPGHVVNFMNLATESDELVPVTVFLSDDGALVVQIDTTGGADRLRVNVNDSTIFDKGVESGTVHEHHPREWVVIEDASWNESDAVDVFNLSFMSDKQADPAEAFDTAMEMLTRLQGKPALAAYLLDLETWIIDRVAE